MDDENLIEEGEKQQGDIMVSNQNKASKHKLQTIIPCYLYLLLWIEQWMKWIAPLSPLDFDVLLD